MRRFLMLLLLLVALPLNVVAKEYESWGEIVDDIAVVLESAGEAYKARDIDGAMAAVNSAYFDYYEVLGFERAVMSYISGKRASVVEYQFTTIKSAISAAKADSVVRTEINTLIKYLQEDAGRLDGREVSAFGTFMTSLLIVMREGIEAILVIAAIIAYLVRAGYKSKVKTVYISSVVAILASVAMAYIINTALATSGASKELLEGVAMLLAVVVLFFVSNWMVSKSETEAWKGYIQGKVQGSVSTGSGLALAGAAFLAVFREGAETILFYQALFADSGGQSKMVFLGLFVGLVLLVVVFLVIRYGSLRLPLKPFFIGTSILMYVMCIVFTGGGIKELQGANVVSMTPVSYVRTIDLLGIYPTMETLVPQAVLVLLAIFSYLYYKNKANKAIIE
ncbi:FTR1 family iron permease [Deferribacterales bacterium RsTz2092]